MLRGIGYVVARRDSDDASDGPRGRQLSVETVACLLIADGIRKVMCHLARRLAFRACGKVAHPPAEMRDE